MEMCINIVIPEKTLPRINKNTMFVNLIISEKIK